MGLSYFHSWIMKATEPRCVVGKPLNGDPEKTLHEAMKVKSGLYWKYQDVGDGNLPRIPANSVWNQREREREKGGHNQQS